MSRKRQLDSDDEEPWRPRRNAKVSETRLSMQREIVPGVGLDDLPIVGPFTSDAVLKYQDMPIARKLNWRMLPTGALKRRNLTNNISCAAALIQTRGDEVSDPCSNCQKDLGPWETCVIMTDEEDSTLAGSCANCQFSRKYNCTFRVIKIDDFEDVNFDGEWKPACEKESRPSTDSSYASSNASAESEEVNGIRSQLGGIIMEELVVLGPVIDGPRQSGARSTKPLETQNLEDLTVSIDVVASSPAAKEHCRQSLVKNENPLETELENLVIKLEQGTTDMTSAPSLSAKGSKLDTDLVRFPLDAEAFDNLPLLERAEPVMANHLEVVRKRIRELKMKEQQKESYNPWDFI